MPKAAPPSPPSLSLGQGDVVVVDAMILADWLASVVTPKPVRDADTVDRLLAACCLFAMSRELEDEVLDAVHTRGVFVPRSAIVKRWVPAKRKFRRVTPRPLSSIRLDPAVAAKVPVEDHHVVRLALARSARCVITREPGFLAADADTDVHASVRILHPSSVMTTGATPPCGREEGLVTAPVRARRPPCGTVRALREGGGVDGGDRVCSLPDMAL